MTIPYSPPNGVKLSFGLSGDHDNSLLDFKFNNDVIDFSGLGTIRGQVQESGEGLPGFVRLVYNNPGKYADGVTVKETKTSTLGTYEFNDINEGLRYDVIASLDGWQKRVLTNIQPFAAMTEPKQVKATFVISENRIAIAWKNRKPVDSIKIYRSETIFDHSSLPQPLSILPGSALGFDDITIEEKTYFYMVENIGSGISLYSTVVSVNAYVIDPLFDKVRLLINFTGVNGDNVFRDSSKNPKTVITKGGAKLSNELPLIGQTSLKLNGLSSDHIEVLNHPDLNLSTLNAYTIETYVKVSSPFAGVQRFFDKDGVPNLAYPQYCLGTMPTGMKLVVFCGNGNGVSPSGTQMLSDTDLIVDKWQHYAYVKEGNSMKLYIDGVLHGSATWTYQADGGKSLLIGGYPGDTHAMKGFIQSIRITSEARYTSNFTPDYKLFPTH